MLGGCEKVKSRASSIVEHDHEHENVLEYRKSKVDKYTDMDTDRYGQGSNVDKDMDMNKTSTFIK